ncbi:hypothetical protein B1218_36355, partial [Pseudomonas ogarae]
MAGGVEKEGGGGERVEEMGDVTRVDCVVGCRGVMGQARSRASHEWEQRQVGGKVVSEQPVMQNVRADVAREGEGALALRVRMGRALDHLN